MELKEYVENASDPWNLKKSGIDERRLKIISSFMKNRGLVLDIGCAYGIYSNELRKLGNSVVGVDFSERMVCEAKSSFKSASFIMCDATATPFAKETFDAVLIMGTAIYIADKPGLYKEISRVLRKGGVLCLIERNKKSLWHVFMDKFRKESQVDEIQNFIELKETKLFLENSGFVIKKISGDKISFPFLSENRLTRKLFWFLGSLFPQSSYFLIIIAEKS